MLSLGSNFIDDDDTPGRPDFLSQERQLGAAVLKTPWPTGDIVACLAVFVVAMCFVWFVCIMLFDQLSNIFSDRTGIEVLQGIPATPVQRHWKEALQEVS